MFPKQQKATESFSDILITGVSANETNDKRSKRKIK